MENSDESPDLLPAEKQISDLNVNGEETKSDHFNDRSDKQSNMSCNSGGSEMEPFDSYKTKIDQLLDSIGYKDFAIEPIQYGYGFQNCVYALSSPQDPTEQLILRVAIDGFIGESDGRHETLGNDVALLQYLKGRLPVPRIKAYSLTTDNELEAAYTIQTRIPGESLNRLWSSMAYPDKYVIVDEFLKPLSKLESVQFAQAGTFSSPAVLPAKSHDLSRIQDPKICNFRGWSKEAEDGDDTSKDNIGSDIKSLLTQHLNSWIQEEISRDQHDLSCSNTPHFKKALLHDPRNGHRRLLRRR